MNIIHIHTLDLPELEPYRTLREKTHHWRGGVFVAEGEKVVRKLLESNVRAISMLLSPDWYAQLEGIINNAKFEDLDVYVGEPELLDGIVGFQMHQNLMAIGEIPPSPALEDLCGTNSGTNVHVAVEGIADAENMGMIIRNCAAFGADTLIVGSDSTSPWLRRSVRVSVGTVFAVRILYVEKLLPTLDKLRTMHGWTLAATTPLGGDMSLPVASAEKPLCLLFGSEAYGLSDKALALCDTRFTIPMSPGADSLNVANAVAVGLYEAVRIR
jgi:tRNA G18 (ribose-2'-O)-methylase SpoU